MNVIRIFCRRNLLRHARQNVLYSHCRLCSDQRQQSDKLLSQIQAKIKFSGPITVADYMNVALTNTEQGYYINKDVFGQKGDFTTSPEISQMFGELVAVWFVNEWMMAGSPDNVKLIELGPGRGTMADDMLRAFSKFPELTKSLSLHLVEISKKLSEMQEEKLSSNPSSMSSDIDSDSTPYYKQCVSKYGPNVYWYRDITDVPAGHTMIVAHEFFDALPIHKFQKTDRGWREVLVDIDPESNNDLRFVLAPTESAASKVILQVDSDDNRDHIEVSAKSGVIIKHLADRIDTNGGCGLVIDYGHNGEKEDTFRAFRNHDLHDVLIEPGSADLTADVDFSYLKKQCNDTVKTFGPVTQSSFLQNLGIAYRLKMLYDKADEKGKKDLLSSFHMLTDSEQMGERFKFLAILNNKCKHSPIGFDPLPVDS
ncbi:NADH dehydrogenase [ubiquinone] complex I [Mactra antiquata]